MKPDPEEPMEQPGPELGSVQPEARTCQVCATKFFATADREFCPVCILRELIARNLQRSENRVQHLSQQPALAIRKVRRRFADSSIMK